MDTQNNTEAAAEQLKNYIKQQLQAGIQPNEIQTQLVQAGWQNDLIQQAFQLVQNDVMPSSTITNSNNTQQNGTGIQQSNQQYPASVPNRGRFKTGWLLFKQSINILRHNEGLTRYIVMSFIVSTILTIIFGIIFFAGRHTLIETVKNTTNGSNSIQFKPLGYVVAFLYYILAYFIINLYSAGLVANVIDLFHGKAQHYRDYMKVAWSKGGTLFVFSIIEATVGLILRAIAERSRLLGRIIVWLVGAAWSLARLFVVPIIVTSNDNPFVAIKRSTKLLLATWGENLVGRVSFGGVAIVIFLLVLVPISIVLIVIGSLIAQGAGALVGIGIAVLLYIIFSIVVSTASSVLNTALFYYAQYKQIPAAFDPTLINSVFIRGKRKNLLR